MTRLHLAARWTGGSAGRWARSGQTRSRLLILAFVAAIPISLMAATIVWQDYRQFGETAQKRAAMLEGQMLAQLRGSIAGVIADGRTTLAKLGGNACTPNRPEPGPEPGAAPPPTLPLIVLDIDGQERCRIGDPPVPSGVKPWFEQVRGGASFGVGVLATGGAVIAARIDSSTDVMAVFLPATWLATVIATDGAEPSAAIWLLDGEGNIVASAGDPSNAQPTLDEVATLALASSSLIGGQSITGRRYAYAATNLASGAPGGTWRLQVALTAQPEHERAVQVLIARSAELGLLLLGGLTAVVLGADVAFGAPLRRLTSAVGRWQAGEAFAPGSLVGAPDEVQQLARSFEAATTVLRHKQEELARAEQQQTLLVMEVHHRVKNNLQVIVSLLNLQASRIRVPEARAEFQAARDRIRALATLHRHLYGDGGGDAGLHTINMRSFLTELCSQLFQAIGEPEGGRIQLLIDVADLRISSDQAVPVALIVTEAVTNAVKYAFPDRRTGTVSVSLTNANIGHTEEEARIDLVISDDGVGIAPDQDGNGECDGIGLRLIRGFSRQLGATLTVEHCAGTRYTIRLPLRSAAPPGLHVGTAAGEGAVS